MKAFERRNMETVFQALDIEMIFIFMTGNMIFNVMRRVMNIVTLNMKFKGKKQLKKSLVVKS